LTKSPLTLRLKAIGVTDNQLQAVRFRSNNRDLPFDQWSFTFIPGTNTEVMDLTKAYCALRWLILEDPPGSRNKDDAWRLVSHTIAAPTYALGLKYKDAQKRRAQRPRGKITNTGLTMKEIIGRLALKAEYRNLTARELWPHLHAELDACELCPRDKKSAYEYDFGEGRKVGNLSAFCERSIPLSKADKISLAGLIVI
jgi:hypothetical protein